MNQAASVLLAGGVVAYPTEAVYGLGCLPLEVEAVYRILALKRRAPQKGLILVAAGLDQLSPFVTLPREPIRATVLASWPGPVTWILPARELVPAWLTGGRDTLAVRVTAHPVARYLAARTGSPIVSTSANVTGRAPLRSALAVRRAFGAELDAIVAGPLGGSSRPTEIRDGRTGRTLRPG